MAGRSTDTPPPHSLCQVLIRGQWRSTPAPAGRHCRQLERGTDRRLPCKFAAHPHHQLAGVLAPEQHAECARRLVQPFQHMQALAQAALAMARGEPGAGFVVAVVVAEHLETLHPPAPRASWPRFRIP